jgi:quercetin dioxygenase-like cupin family protein
MRKLTSRRRVAALAAVVIAAGVLTTVTMASPPFHVTPTILSRGTFDNFKVKTDSKSPIDLELHSKAPMDVVVRRHDYLPGGNTGWHQHPGPILITVTMGQLTYYEADDPTCTGHVVTAGHGFVDTGDGHFVRNESDQPAQDVSVIFAPVGGAFRTELPAPNPYCGF